MYYMLKRFLAAALILVLSFGAAGCGIQIKYADGGPAEPSTSQQGTVSESPPADVSEAVSPETSPSPQPSPSAPPVKLVPYDGIVEHIFFHPTVAYPELAFDGDAKEKGIDQNMVTVSEYNKMLQGIYDKGYIIVNMNDVWTEYEDSAGVMRMKKTTLMLPEGKKPLIISYDDTNYYDYMYTNGFTHKLVIRNDEIWSYGLDPSGKEVYSQDLDAITILDKFIKEHPDFSLNGAKGCLCLTGYEGILGYRTMTDTKGMTAEMEARRQSEIKAVKPIVAKLKETGWYFGSHSWGHINLSTSSISAVQADTQRWLNEVGSLVGPTTLYFYPFGARPDGDDVRKTGPIFNYLQSLGFRVFASVGIESYTKIKTDITAVICDRMHPDGATLRTQRERYLKFYDAKLVFDDLRPDYGVNW
ncbi:MAG: hydrolase [Clostridiales bacterium]|nr:hydrolase [Clostridiales bacterium]